MERPASAGLLFTVEATRSGGPMTMIVIRCAPRELGAKPEAHQRTAAPSSEQIALVTPPPVVHEKRDGAVGPRSAQRPRRKTRKGPGWAPSSLSRSGGARA